MPPLPCHAHTAFRWHFTIIGHDTLPCTAAMMPFASGGRYDWSSTMLRSLRVSMPRRITAVSLADAYSLTCSPRFPQSLSFEDDDGAAGRFCTISLVTAMRVAARRRQVSPYVFPDLAGDADKRAEECASDIPASAIYATRYACHALIPRGRAWTLYTTGALWLLASLRLSFLR